MTEHDCYISMKEVKTLKRFGYVVLALHVDHMLIVFENRFDVAHLKVMLNREF